MKKTVFILPAMGLLFVALVVLADVPPPNARPLSSIIRSIETGGHGVIKDIEFDDGFWEAKTCKDTCTKLYIDPMSGAIARTKQKGAEKELPPQGSLPLSGIVASLEGQKLGTITEVDYENGAWEVEIRKDGTKRKLIIDPRTGRPRS